MKKMKSHFLAVVLISVMGLLGFKNDAEVKMASLCGDTIPVINQTILNLVNENLNKKVGRGECWDLAALVLNSTHAKWNGKYKYGELYDPKSSCVYPGDLIQFEGVLTRYQKDGMQWEEDMSHHTAVVYEVKADGQYIIAHQNYGNGKRKVGLSPFNMADVKKGKLYFYHPVP